MNTFGKLTWRLALTAVAAVAIVGGIVAMRSQHPAYSKPMTTGSGPGPVLAASLTPTAPPPGHEVATLAGGCFWAMQAEFAQLKGVDSVVAGYAGGHTDKPTYEVVEGGDTGYTETVQIVYDPAVLSYHDLLTMFLREIDPTTKDRQGNDVGTNYRSAIFYHDAAQKATADKVIAEITAAHVYSSPIVTEVDAYTKFWPAEDYHQNYYIQHPTESYCAYVVAGEVDKFRTNNAARLKGAS